VKEQPLLHAWLVEGVPARQQPPHIIAFPHLAEADGAFFYAGTKVVGGLL
jgi:hypothetical protein